MVDTLCKECANYAFICLCNRSVELCMANVDNCEECTLHKELMKKEEQMTPREIALKFKVSVQTIQMLLCRAEFAHLKRVRRTGTLWYQGITEEDLTRIKELLQYRGRGRTCRR